MVVGVKRLLPQSGSAIFRRVVLQWYNSFKADSFEALEKWLSARNASCRKAVIPMIKSAGSDECEMSILWL